MVIRQTQMDAFDGVNDDEFVERLKNILRETYPVESAAYFDDAFEEMIREGLRRARQSYGMRWETALGDFCGLKLQLGERFDEDPEIEPFLTDESVPPNERINRMFRAFGEADWQRVRRRLDAQDAEKADRQSA